MEALGATASVIAVATLAWQSTKATYEIIDGLVEAPTVIADSRRRLSETQDVLVLLQTQLKPHTESPNSSRLLDSLLQEVKLEKSLELIRRLCDEFQITLKGYTKHSSDSKISNRDRFSVHFHESTIRRFNTELSNCHSGLTTVLASINVLLSSRISDGIDGLGASLAAQLTTLDITGQQLAASRRDLLSLPVADITGGEPSDAPDKEYLQLTTELEAVCKRTSDIVEAKRTGQKFGTMQLDKSVGMQGIVGAAQKGVDQDFGDMKASNGSKGFQGKMDSGSFAKMFS